MSLADLDLLDHRSLASGESWGVSQPQTLVLVLRGSWRALDPPAALVDIDFGGSPATTTLTLELSEGRSADLDPARIRLAPRAPR